MDTMMQVASDEPVPPSRLQPNVPRDLETICLNCLQKDGRKRYVTAAALAEDLARFRDDRPITARPVGTLEQGWRWCRRNPMVASLAAAVAASLLAGTIISTHFGVQAGIRAEEASHEKDRADGKATEAAEQKDRADQKAVEAENSARHAREERLRADRRSYLSDMRLAQRAWEDAKIGDLMKLLDGQRPERTGNVDLRGFEWFYWQRLCQADLFTFKEHGGPVQGVAFSPDGKRLASASQDGTVGVWDTVGGKVTLLLKGHSGRVSCVAFSPDGKRLASAGEDKTVKVWDAGSGKEIFTLKGHGQTVHGVAFSPDGQRLASASEDRTVKIWDLKAGTETFTFKGHSGPLLSVAFSPDGKQMASCGGIQDTRGTAMDKSVKVWDAATGQVKHSFTFSQYPFLNAVFSPDGLQLVAASYEQVKVYDLDSGKESFSLVGHKGYVVAVAFDKDGKRLASASWDRTVRVWDAANGQELLVLKGHADRVLSVAFSPNGNQLASASEDRTVKIWDLNRKQEALTIRPGSQVQGLAISQDGQRLALGTGPPSIWDLPNVRKLRAFEGEHAGPASVALSADGRFVASVGKVAAEVVIRDQANGQPIHTLKGHKNRILCLAFSPDGRALATASMDQTIKIWDVQSGKLVRDFQGHVGSVHSLAFTPDGRSLASAGDDRLVILWDMAGGQPKHVLRGHTGPIHSVAMSRDGKWLASGSEDLTIRIWDLSRARESTILRGHAGMVYCLAFHPQGPRLVSGGQDGTVMVWDLASGTATLTFKAHATCVHGVLFTPDGQRLISGSCDNSVKIWDARPLDDVLLPPAAAAVGRPIDAADRNAPRFREVRRFVFPDEVRSLAFAPDGLTLAVATGRYPQGQDPVKPGAVRLLNRATGRELMTLAGHTDGVNSVAFSPDGKLLATGSTDGTAKLWDLAAGKEKTTFEIGQWVWGVVFSPDGKTLATAASGRGPGPHGIRIWDVATGRELVSLRRNDPWSFCVAVSSDGMKWTDWSLNGLMVWDAASGKNLATCRGHNGEVHAVAFSPDAKLLVSGCNDKTVKLWNAVSGRVQATIDHSSAVHTVAFSPDGKMLASGSHGLVNLWELADCRGRLVAQVRQVLRTNSLGITCLAFAGEGKFLAAASSDKTVSLLEQSDRPSVPTYDEAWIKSVRALPAEKQVEAIASELQRLNPAFDGNLKHKIDQGAVIEVDLTGARGLRNIRPLQALSELHGLLLAGTEVANLSPLQGMKLTDLTCYATPVADLSPLKDMPLRNLYCGGTAVCDLSPLKAMRLEALHCDHTKVTDLSVLKEMPLWDLSCDFKPFRDSELLRSLQTLKRINGEPAAEFWKEVDEKSAAFEQWAQETQKQPAAKQVEAVAMKLQELNPGFDGAVTPVLEGSVVTGLSFLTEKVSNISAVRALKRLTTLTVGHQSKPSILQDLSPLKALSLTRLGIYDCPVLDLGPIQGMPLRQLMANGTKVADLRPLAGMPLKSLYLAGTQVSDLSPLRGMPLELLDFPGAPVTDFSPLQNTSLKYIICTVNTPRDADILRSIETLETINRKPKAEFWKEMDAKLPQKKP